MFVLKMYYKYYKIKKRKKQWRLRYQSIGAIFAVLSAVPKVQWLIQDHSKMENSLKFIVY